MKCPKCAFESQSIDKECPRCGIIYSKWEHHIVKKRGEEKALKEMHANEKAKREVKNTQQEPIMVKPLKDSEKNMKPYVKAGRLFRFLGWIGIGGIVVAIAIPIMINFKTPSLQPDASSWLPTLLLLVLLSGLSVLQLMVGTAIKEHKNWGRTVGIVLGIIQLFVFPIGTLIGAHILWCLIKGWEQGEKMPDGGSDNCWACAFNQVNNGKWGHQINQETKEQNYCKIRKISISNPIYTYCANWHTKKDEPYGPMFSPGLSSAYVRIPWNNEREPKTHAHGKCSICETTFDKGIKVDTDKGEEVQFCCNRHYAKWWKIKHPDQKLRWDMVHPEQREIIKWLTCEEKLEKGPRRLLIVLSIPFFLYFIIPGILFWLFVRVVLWIIDGFKKDTERKHVPISKED